MCELFPSCPHAQIKHASHEEERIALGISSGTVEKEPVFSQCHCQCHMALGLPTRDGASHAGVTGRELRGAIQAHGLVTGCRAFSGKLGLWRKIFPWDSALVKYYFNLIIKFVLEVKWSNSERNTSACKLCNLFLETYKSPSVWGWAHGAIGGVCMPQCAHAGQRTTY